MNVDTVIFFVSAAVAVFGATMMITQRNPIAAVLYLIVSLLAQAVLYIQLGAVFLGALLIIIYAGAILVLFLFVIMLLNLRGREEFGSGGSPFSKVTALIVSVLLVVELIAVARSAVFVQSGPVGMMGKAEGLFGSVEQVGTLLFTKYLYPFELTSILLLAAIVGAVVMAGGKSTQTSPEEQPLDESQPHSESEEVVR